ncbi:hypothetical protein NPIL_136451 [Nephila pilipes]|uniref:Uncharacterized protein n=1 Tax=Nephila pilipes TaxID=299642 RepID=A0A8X6IF22_NEPPI|nr:hypothetical protein NPIL_136451 [Nephila pilipes]
MALPLRALPPLNGVAVTGSCKKQAAAVVPQCAAEMACTLQHSKVYGFAPASDGAVLFFLPFYQYLQQRPAPRINGSRNSSMEKLYNNLSPNNIQNISLILRRSSCESVDATFHSHLEKYTARRCRQNFCRTAFTKATAYGVSAPVLRSRSRWQCRATLCCAANVRGSQRSNAARLFLASSFRRSACTRFAAAARRGTPHTGLQRLRYRQWLLRCGRVW